MSDDRDHLAEALPRYEIGDEIGRGGWGVVYRGVHRELARAVAIKQLPRSLGADPAVRDRFVAEARIVAGLEHPHIVPVYDFVERDGLYVIVMELAGGGTLRQRFTEVGLTVEDAIATVLAVAVGLHHAHSHNLLHRDVKPDNVLYATSGRVKIADFGIAKVMGQGEGSRTATGAVIGTPAFMAPEQVLGGQLSPATDIYALAVVLFELLSGELPFVMTGNSMSQLFQHVHEPPRRLATIRPQLPAPLDQVVSRALAKDPGHRPQTAEQFATELATAATMSFGRSWLERTGIAVMGSTAVIGATERDNTPPRSSNDNETVLVNPALSAAHPSPPTEIGAAPAPRPVPQPADQPAPPPASHQQADPQHEIAPASAIGRPPWVVGLIGVVAVVALIVAGAVGFGLLDDDETITDEQRADRRATFLQACDDNGVSRERCGCAATRALAELEPEVLEESLEEMVKPAGALTPELAAIFRACADDGS